MIPEPYFIAADLINKRWQHINIAKLKECVEIEYNLYLYDVYNNICEVVPNFILIDYIAECKDEDAKHTSIASIMTRREPIEDYDRFILSSFHPSWINTMSLFLFSDKDFKRLLTAFQSEKEKRYYPDLNQIFNVFLTDLERVKGAIINVSPINDNTSTGFCFATQNNLSNAENDLFMDTYKRAMGKGSLFQMSRELTEIKDKGVLLLNYALTSTKDNRMAHVNIWVKFIYEVIRTLNKKTKFSYLLLGDNATALRTNINRKHEVFATRLLNYYMVKKEPVPIATFSSFFKTL